MTDQQIDQVCQLSDWLAGTDITLLELSGPGKLIRLRRNGSGNGTSFGAEPAAPAAGLGIVPTTAPTAVRAGCVGIVLHSHPLRSAPLVHVGQEVVNGQTVALLKIGLVLLPVAAPRAGTVSRIVAAHASVVGFGEPLLELE